MLRVKVVPLDVLDYYHCNFSKNLICLQRFSPDTLLWRLNMSKYVNDSVSQHILITLQHDFDIVNHQTLY